MKLTFDPRPPALFDAHVRSVIVVSPHRDDAVFSCGALLWMLRQRGTDILVVNVFTEYEGLPQYTALARSIVESVDADPRTAAAYRLAEDRLALGALNCRETSLQEFDAVCRTSDTGEPFYSNQTEITRLNNEDADRIIPAITAKLDTLVRSVDDRSIILAPAAIGGHVDHTICARIMANSTFSSRTIYYEDVPYALAHSARPDKKYLGINLPDIAIDAQIGAGLHYRSQIRIIWPSPSAFEASLRTHFGAAGQTPYIQHLYEMPLL